MLRLLDKIENIFVVFTFFLATFLVFMNVILRSIGYGTTWSEELIRYLIIWLTFIGASICVRKSEHVGIDLLPEILPQIFKRMLTVIVNIIAISFLVFVVKYSLELIEFNQARKQIAPALGIPMYLVYYCLPIGSALMILRYIMVTINLFKNVEKKTNDDSLLKG